MRKGRTDGGILRKAALWDTTRPNLPAAPPQAAQVGSLQCYEAALRLPSLAQRMAELVNSVGASQYIFQ